jgi:hypothetical protein
MERRQVGISFSGGAFSSLGYSLLFIFLFLFIIPGAWGAAAFMLWWTGHMVFPDGTRASFEGRPGRVWALFAALAVLAYLPSLATFGMPPGNRTNAISIVLTLALVPFEVALKLPIYRWMIEGIRLEPGGSPRFTASYPAYLGWVCLLIVSLVTIIGWAWVAVAMLRWFCRNIVGDDYTVAFAGTGWGLLWRGFVWLVGSCLLIPLPWVLRSMYAWMTNNLLLIRSGQEAAQFATAA